MLLLIFHPTLYLQSVHSSPLLLPRTAQDAASEAEKEELLKRWGRLHLVRTLLSCTSFGVMAYTLYRVRGSSTPRLAAK
jgi:hypothetical protein